MRTTITLTPEAEALVLRAMTERGLSFKEVVNAAIVDALAPASGVERYETPTLAFAHSIDAVQAVRDMYAEDDARILRLGGLP